MLTDLLYWIAVSLTILGTCWVSLKVPKALHTNIVYGIASGIFIFLFSADQNWAMVVQYCVLVGFAVNGIRNHYNAKSPIEICKTECPFGTILKGWDT